MWDILSWEIIGWEIIGWDGGENSGGTQRSDESDPTDDPPHTAKKTWPVEFVTQKPAFRRLGGDPKQKGLDRNLCQSP